MKSFLIISLLLISEQITLQSKEYIDSERTFSIVYPSDWILRNDEKIKQTYSIILFAPKSETVFSIRKYISESKETKAFRLAIQNSNKLKELTSEHIPINGVDTKIITMESIDPISKKQIITKEALVKTKKTTFVLSFSYMKEKAEDYKYIFDLLFKNFKSLE